MRSPAASRRAPERAPRSRRPGGATWARTHDLASRGFRRAGHASPKCRNWARVGDRRGATRAGRSPRSGRRVELFDPEGRAGDHRLGILFGEPSVVEHETDGRGPWPALRDRPRGRRPRARRARPRSAAPSAPPPPRSRCHASVRQRGAAGSRWRARSGRSASCAWTGRRSAATRRTPPRSGRTAPRSPESFLHAH